MIALKHDLFVQESVVSYQSNKELPQSEIARQATDLYSLGIMEYDDYEENAKYIVVKGSGLIDQALAVCETISLYQKVPFKKDILKKIIQQQVSRSKPISIELIAGLFELLGLSSQMAEIETIYLSAVEGPIVLLINSIPTVLFAVKINKQLSMPFKRSYKG